MLWRVPASLLIVMVGWWFFVRPMNVLGDWVDVPQEFALCSDRGSGTAGCVVDGDTVIIGFGQQRRRIRLTGFDAPELEGACPAESKSAITARDALHDWLAQGAFEWSGGNDPAYDKYGRELREVRRATVNGRYEYLSETMIDRKLASESGWDAWPNDWCNQ